jgi:hypothetical protein
MHPVREGASIPAPAAPPSPVGDGAMPEGPFESLIAKKAQDVGIFAGDTVPAGGVSKLLTYLAGVSTNNPDFNALPLVAQIQRRPLSADMADKAVLDLVKPASTGDMGAITSLIARVLDNPALPDATMRLPRWIGPLADPGESAAARAQVEQLVRTLRDDVGIAVAGDRDRALTNLAAIRRGLDMQAILSHQLSRLPAIEGEGRRRRGAPRQGRAASRCARRHPRRRAGRHSLFRARHRGRERRDRPARRGWPGPERLRHVEDRPCL